MFCQTISPLYTHNFIAKVSFLTSYVNPNVIKNRHAKIKKQLSTHNISYSCKNSIGESKSWEKSKNVKTTKANKKRAVNETKTKG